MQRRPGGEVDMVDCHDVVVIGAGQAGLAMSAVLSDRGREHVVLERSRVAERWRSERWDSLRFQFPNWSIAMPGYRYSGADPDGFAPAAEIAGLLQGYAAAAPVREQTEVVSLDWSGSGFSIVTSDDTLQARHVVVATGPFQRPRIPPQASQLPANIVQTDPTRYRNPGRLPPGAVLVVGAGASGIQIAEELVGAGRTVFLAVSRHRRTPRRFRGRDVYWWLDRLGRFDQTIDTFPGRRWPPHTAVTGVNGGYDIDLRKLAGAGARVVGSVRGISGSQVVLANNVNQILDDADAAYLSFIEAARSFAASIEEPMTEDDAVVPRGSPVPEVEKIDIDREGITSVIWATGYEYDYDWLHADVTDTEGRPVQQRGVTAVPGLLFLGLHWMHTFKSGLLSGVGSDAAFLADRINQQR
jgi:putative flavoprotein involved in K+ transport